MIFFMFTPIWVLMIQFDFRIFFNWVGKTTNCFQDRRKVDHLVPRLEFWVYKWPRLESKEDEVEWCGDVWDEWVASGLQ